MRKSLFSLLAGLLIGSAVFAGAQSPSSGGAFLPLEPIVYGPSHTTTYKHASPLVFEGATDDASELTLTVGDVTSDVTATLPTGGNAAFAFMVSALTTNNVGAANSVWGVSNGLTFEGATADAGELFLTVSDIATASRTMTLPDMGAASAVIASTLTTNTAAAATHTLADGVPHVVRIQGLNHTGTEAPMQVSAFSLLPQ